MASGAAVPPAHSFAWTIVQALRELGGSGSVSEINERCVKLRKLTEEQQSIPHHPGSRTEVEYRLAWARTLAKNLGLLVNSERGVWALTDVGGTITREQVEKAKKERTRKLAAKRKAQTEAAVAAGVDLGEDGDVLAEGADAGERDWKEILLASLRAMHPDAFERLATRLLREAGFVNVSVVGRPGDGASTVSVSIGCPWCPSRSTSSASGTPSRWGRPRSVTSAGRWPAAATRGFSSPRARSPPTRRPRRPATAPHRSI